MYHHKNMFIFVLLCMNIQTITLCLNYYLNVEVDKKYPAMYTKYLT